MKWKVGILALACLCLALTAGCDQIGRGGNEPLPTLVLDTPSATGETAAPAPQNGGGKVVASGFVAAAHEVNLSSASGGVVEELLTQEGERVRAGQTLVRLAGSERLSAALESAQYELLAAQQGRKALDERLETDRAAAQLRLANANKALDEAQKQRTWRQYRNGSDALIEAGQADLILAKEALEKAQEAYDSVSAHDDFSVAKAGALSALASARRAYDRAVSNLNYLEAMPNELEVARVEAELVSAQAEAKNASDALARLKDGPDPEAVALAEGRIRSAQAAVVSARKAAADLEIKAPLDATIGAVLIQAGEWAQTGQPLLVLIDLGHLTVETSDLSERDIPRVALGQAVQVSVDALGEELTGKVVRISPLAETLGGDVIYKTTIELETVPAGLLPGMSVDVRFDPIEK